MYSIKRNNILRYKTAIFPWSESILSQTDTKRTHLLVLPEIGEAHKW